MHCMLVATFFDFGSNLRSNLEMTEKRIQERKKRERKCMPCKKFTITKICNTRN